MVRPGAALVVCTALAAASPVRAEDDPATALSGVGVTLPNTCIEARDPPSLDVPAPKLIATYPATGQVVRPGLLILRLHFDLPMGCRARTASKLTVMETRPPDPCASSHIQRWVLLKERLDWTVLCRLAPKTHYSFRLKHFKGLSGREVEPFTLTFDTSDESPVATIAEAIAVDPGRPRATPQPVTAGVARDNSAE